MMNFFKTIIKSKPVINQAVLIEAQKTFGEIKKLQDNGSIDNLKKALFEINEAEKKYPFCYDTVRFYRGEVISSLVSKGAFINENPSSSVSVSMPKSWG